MADDLRKDFSEDVSEDTYPEPLKNFTEGQWWVQELDGMHKTATPDQKRAIAVVHHLLKSVKAYVDT